MPTARDLVVSASTSVPVDLETESWPGLTKTLQTGAAAFLPGAHVVKKLRKKPPKSVYRSSWSALSLEILHGRFKYAAGTISASF